MEHARRRQATSATRGRQATGLAVPWGVPSIVIDDGQPYVESFDRDSLQHFRDAMPLTLGHGGPVVARLGDTLRLNSTDKGLEFEATLDREVSAHAASVEYHPIRESTEGRRRHVHAGALDAIALVAMDKSPAHPGALVRIREARWRQDARQLVGVNRKGEAGQRTIRNSGRRRKSRLDASGTRRIFDYPESPIQDNYQVDVALAADADIDRGGIDGAAARAFFTALRGRQGAAREAADTTLALPGGRPVASTSSGTLAIGETPQGVWWSGELTGPYADEAVELVEAGLAHPTLSYYSTPTGTRDIPEPGNEAVAISIVTQALLPGIVLLGRDGEAAAGGLVGFLAAQRNRDTWTYLL